MRLSYSWLKDHLETTKPMEALVAKLEEIAFEVDWIWNPKESLRDIVVAEIQDVENHPQADKLHICRVFDGQKVLQVVCGAPNVYKGMKTALVHVGGFVPILGETLKAAKIRGVESQAMMCSPRELQIADVHEGILDITSEAGATPGRALVEAIGLDDPVINVVITPNRGDCLSVRGLARELAAAGMGTLKPLSYAKFGVPQPASLEGHSATDPLKVHIETSGCGLFCGAIVKGLIPNESPEWIKQRLHVAGQKSINVLVDLTNYLCFDLGQPMHAYDRKKIHGDLYIRQATQGENLLLLNDEECQLTPEDMIIADEVRPLILAGVMGGQDSGSSEETTEVLLEAAYFEAVPVTLSGQRHCLRSESRSRFERGIDREQTPTVLAWTVALVQHLCGGTCQDILIAGTPSIPHKTLSLSQKLLLSFSGDGSLTLAGAQATLEALGFETLSVKDETLTVSVPSWRNDVEHDVDLIEEILRMRGYANLPYKTLPVHSANAAVDPHRLLRETLCERGLNEIYALAFMSERERDLFGAASTALEVLSPLSSDMAFLRTTLLTSLLRVVAYNQSHVSSSGALFEIESVFSKASPEAHDEHKVIAGVRFGNTPPHWLEKTRPVDVFDAKADILALLATCKIASYQVKTESLPPYYHPYKSGTLVRGREILGHFGELHPALTKALDLDAPVVMFELFLTDSVTAKMGKADTTTYHHSSLQPLTRDFAFVLDAAVPAQQLVDAVRKTDPQIVSVDVFDVYEKLEQGQKSIAVRVVLQPTRQTFTDEALQLWSQKVIQSVQEKCGGVLR